MKGDGNIGAIVQWIMSDLHLAGIENVLRRYVCASMTFHRNRRYFFSDRTARLTLTADRRDYKPGDGFGLPDDLIEIASRVMWILRGGSNDQREPCVRTTTTLFEESLMSWGNSKDTPEEWDFRGGSIINGSGGGVLRFSPAPSSSTDIAEFRYLTNLGIPRVTWESGAFAFYHPTTGTLLTSAQLDAWVNDWTTQEAGATAIRFRTQYSVQKNYLKDLEGAQESLAGWLEAVGQLEDETESKTTGVTYLDGCLLD